MNTAERTTAAASPQYPNVQILADGSSLQWSGIYVRRYRYPRLVDSLLVPATPEPLIACVIDGSAQFRERDIGAAWVTSIIGSHAVSEFKIMVVAALNVGVTPIEVKEIVYQSFPYVGMARAFDFVHATNDVLTARGIELSLESQSTTDPKSRYDEGLAVQKAVFGTMIEEMYKRSPRDQLHIQRSLSANCFRDHYTRTGIDIKVRELITLSILIGLGGVESQIKGHPR